MAKPWIGIPTRYHDKTEIVGQIRHYLDAVIWAGGLPLLIPTLAPVSVVREYAQRVEGILLPGSPTDIDPARYGAQPHPRLGKMYPEREATDFALLEHAQESEIPVLGICFGNQSLNVFRGGKLIQDIPSCITNPMIHDEDDDSNKVAKHIVQLEENSLLARLAGTSTVGVNSYHHQAVEQPGENLRVAARAPDGVVEAVEDTTGRFMVGVQWHPERGWQDDAFSRSLFTTFIREAEKSQSHGHSV